LQGKITEADTPTIWLDATASGRISDPPTSSLIFTPDALTAATLPIYLGLGQPPNMLACIPSGLVCLLCGKASHRVCKPAYLVPVPSQDKLGELWQEEHLA